MADRKDWKAIVEELPRQGWTVEPTTRGHFKAVPPDPTQEIVHFSHSDDHHALMNVIRDLKRRGFVWPPPSKKDIAVERRLDAEDNPTVKACDVCGLVECLCSEAGYDSHILPETPEAKMDRLFAELKDAKTYVALTHEQLQEWKKRVEDATRALTEADAEHSRAVAAMQKLKTDFDRAFEAAA
jgi:hypothetical protein